MKIVRTKEKEKDYHQKIQKIHQTFEKTKRKKEKKVILFKLDALYEFS